MNQSPRTLTSINDGDALASSELLPLVYDELRRIARARMAQESADHTLTPTALVHEAFVRLVGSDDAQRWECRGHFFAAAAEAMRRILVESARSKGRQRRGGEWHRIHLDDAFLRVSAPVDELLQLDEALEKLEAEDPDAAQIVKLRYFLGLTVEQAGAKIGISRATAYRHWAYARAWLFCELHGGDTDRHS